MLSSLYCRFAAISACLASLYNRIRTSIEILILLSVFQNIVVPSTERNIYIYMVINSRLGHIRLVKIFFLHAHAI